MRTVCYLCGLKEDNPIITYATVPFSIYKSPVNYYGI